MVAEDGYKMSGHEEENPKEPGGEVMEQVQDIETVGDLKREKATKKTAFTKVRRYLLTVIQREDINSQVIKDASDELDIVLENVMSAMDKLFERYKMDRESRSAERLGEEIEQIEIEYSNAQNRAQKFMDSLSLSKRYEKFLNKIQQRKQKYHCTRSKLNSLVKKKCFSMSSQQSRKVIKSFYL